MSPAPKRIGAAPNVRHYTFASSALQAKRLAADVAQLLRGALSERGVASLIVSGGRSPVAFFEELSGAELPWNQVTVSLADERVVDTAAGESNERLVRTHLLVNAARHARFVPLRSAIIDPEIGLAERNHALQRIPRPFDVVVLGMGEDGHTASMFPRAKGLKQALDASADPALVRLTLADTQARISLNLCALLDTHCVCLLIQGSAKFAVLEKACAGALPSELPIAAIVQQDQVPVHIYWAA